MEDSTWYAPKDMEDVIDNTPEHTSFFRPECPYVYKWAQMHLLSKQCGAGRENENCVELKLTKTLKPGVC